MRTRNQSETGTDSHLSSSSSESYQEQVPWWKELALEARSELELVPARELTSRRYDVIVIGAGVAGLSATLALKERERALSVLTLEKEAVLGYGATGRNAGICTPGINMAMSEIPPESGASYFYPETTKLFHALIAQGQEPGTLLDVRKIGAFNLATSLRGAKKLEREAQLRREAGLRAELRTPGQVAEATGGRLNTRAVKLAMWLPDEGRIQPLTLLAHLARRARQQYDITIAGMANVTHYEAGRHWQVTLADGTSFQSRALVNCVGPTVEANARIYALAFAADLPQDFPLFWDASPYTYADYRPGHGRLSVSGGRYGKAGVTRNDGEYYKRLADATRRWLPELAKKQPLYRWAVDLSVTADLIPHTRILDEQTPGVAIEGLGAHGVLPGMVLARQAADWLMNRLA